MSKDSDAQIIQPPNLLRAKIGTKPGPDLDRIVAQAETALDGLKDQYETWIRDYLDAIVKALDEARASHPPDPAAIAQIRKISHELKGQGETFGYPLLTQSGHMLHGLIDKDERLASRNLSLIAAYVDFMNLVVKNEVHDMVGLDAAQLMSALETATKKLLKED